MKNYRAIVIGCSAGGLQALEKILASLSKGFRLPIVVVQHMSPDSGGLLPRLLIEKTGLIVKEAEDKEPLCPGTVYIAPPDYHLLLEMDGTLSLSVDEKVNHSRPSIDVLFESAADAYGSGLVGVILTGSNADGASGLKKIHEQGGFTIVQEPVTAAASEMPTAALQSVQADRVLTLAEIGGLLASLNRSEGV